MDRPQQDGTRLSTQELFRSRRITHSSTHVEDPDVVARDREECAIYTPASTEQELPHFCVYQLVLGGERTATCMLDFPSVEFIVRKSRPRELEPRGDANPHFSQPPATAPYGEAELAQAEADRREDILLDCVRATDPIRGREAAGRKHNPVGSASLPCQDTIRPPGGIEGGGHSGTSRTASVRNTG